MKNNHCPITYAPLAEGQRYSDQGLKLLDKRLRLLHDLPLTAAQQRQEALQRAGKISIAGVQAKLSARLSVAHSCFEIVDKAGTYILKPPSDTYPHLPPNEDLTMRLAASVGIDVPLHGLLYAKDATLTYFIKRFDRQPRGVKIAVEDFAQLAGLNRDTKYNSSMEKVVQIIDEFCTFPVLEKRKLLARTIFNFLIGNEDMHLKNFSLMRVGPKVVLSPAYDLVNTTMALGSATEELALPLNGKKTKIKREDLIDYFAGQRMKLNKAIIKEVLTAFENEVPAWPAVVNKSFLPPRFKQEYCKIIEDRAFRFGR